MASKQEINALAILLETLSEIDLKKMPEGAVLHLLECLVHYAPMSEGQILKHVDATYVLHGEWGKVRAIQMYGLLTYPKVRLMEAKKWVETHIVPHHF